MTILDKDFWIAHKLASIWVAAFWGAFGGVLLFLPALANSIAPWQYAVLCIFMSLTFALARITNQPGAV